MSIHTVNLQNVRYSDLVELLENSSGTFRGTVFMLNGCEYYVTGLTYTHDAEGGQYRFNFQTDQDPVFKYIYM